MRDPRHQPQRRHLMGYPHAYAAAGMRAYSIQKVGNNMKYIKNIILLIYFIYSVYNPKIISISFSFIHQIFPYSLFIQQMSSTTIAW